MKLLVQLVTWNGAKYVPFLFDSLRKQTFLDWHLVIIDNHSTDGTVKAIKKELEHFPVAHTMIENTENIGFAGGHNAALKHTKGVYVMMLNQDMYMQPDCFEKLTSFLDTHREVAVVSPRLMKWNFNEAVSDLQKSFTDQIDSLGLQVFRNRRMVEKYASASWQELYRQLGEREEIPVFGVSGALPMFRTSALRTVLHENGDIFDSSFHAYKEDVDLAYRLAAVGAQARILPAVAAYHDRSAVGAQDLSDRSATMNKKTQSGLVKYHSYKNHLMVLYKNEYWQNFILDFPWILWYELKKLIYFILFDRSVLVGIREIWQLRAELKHKRMLIKKMRTISWRQMRVLWKI